MRLIVQRLLPKLARNRYLPLWVGIFSLAINFPTTQTGLKADDVIHREKIRGNPQLRQSRLLYPESPSLTASVKDLFTWVNPHCRASLKNYGIVPWWGSPDLKVSFFRPVASFTHWIDYRFWPDRSSIMLLENLIWLAALLAMLVLLLQKVIESDAALLFAAAILLFNTYLLTTASWIASRYALMAAFFGVSAIFTYHVFRSSNRMLLLYASLFLFTIGLFCGESAAAAIAYILGYAIAIDHGKPLKRYGFPGLFLVVAVFWRFFYTQSGFGIIGSGFYVSPENDISRYMLQLFQQAPIITASGFLGIFLYHFLVLPPRLLIFFSLATAVLCGLIGMILFSTVKRFPIARWFLIGLLGALPLSCTSIHFGERMTIFVVMGMAPLSGLFLSDLYAKKPLNLKSLRNIKTVAAVLFAIALLGSHLINHPVLRMRDYALFFSQKLAPIQEEYEPLRDDKRIDSTRDLIVVNLINPVLYYYPYYQIAEQRPYARSFRLLVSSPHQLSVKRIDSLTLMISSASTLLPDLHSITQIMPKSDQLYDYYYFMMLPSSNNQTYSKFSAVDVPGMHVTVDSVNAKGLPLKARFSFHRSLENASYVWLAWNYEKEHFEYFQVPRVGDSITLAGAFQ